MSKDYYPPEADRDCLLCPRLVEFRRENQQKFPDFFNGAVPSYGPAGGDTAVEFLIIGLAPGLKGANWSGRPFTGDYAGDLLYDVLLEAGLASGTYDRHPDDGMELRKTMITNAVRCVPPQNKPIGAEINTCRPFLVSRIESLKNLKVMMCLGKISHDSTIKTLGLKLKDYPFGHGAIHSLPDGKTLIDSYHCSRYNVNTNRLTRDMFMDVVKTCRTYL
ncbi:uracil-DNA glycosylase [Kordiimonas sediminis]|uniref:Type-5 uracil-DNA glycosylase n=1 Tax=Kordiimonas sediminis TaxID=1735581 RepID=A0A919AYL9_9PROT|nr:uracil-DNA glycosylase [Kordiimonas sediminis]GHF29723.1 uracil-DNA glycosylase [Kordiimonas sediminis]